MEDAGVFKYLMTYLQGFLKAHVSAARAAKLVDMFNESLGEMPRHEKDVLPEPGRQYFCTTPLVQACEHRGGMQVLPHIWSFGEDNPAERALSRSLVDLAVTWVTAYMDRHRERHTKDILPEDLEQMQRSHATFVSHFTAAIATVMSGRGATIKMHRLSHFVRDIERFGSLRHSSASFHGQNHGKLK